MASLESWEAKQEFWDDQRSSHHQQAQNAIISFDLQTAKNEVHAALYADKQLKKVEAKIAELQAAGQS